MKSVKCPTCSRKVMKYGKTRAGVQRWFCKVCHLSFTNVYNDATKIFQSFFIGYSVKKLKKICQVKGVRLDERQSDFGTFGHFHQRLMLLEMLYMLIGFTSQEIYVF